MSFALWAWLLAVFANTADTMPGPLYYIAKYKTSFIEQPVSTKFFELVTQQAVGKMRNCGLRNAEGKMRNGMYGKLMWNGG